MQSPEQPGTVVSPSLQVASWPVMAVSVNPVLRVAGDLYLTAKPGGPPVVTDKAGRFTLVDVIPGMAFHVQYRKGQTYYRPKGGEPTFSLKPSESRDVGERTLEPLL